MHGRLGWWSKGADRRSLGCVAGRGISRAEKFDCDLGQIGPESILLPDPWAPASNAVVESRTETLRTLDESSPQRDINWRIGSFPQGTGTSLLGVDYENRPP
jgi:hypothetical protein